MICTSCPRECGVLRIENSFSDGFCKMPYNAVLARAALHFWEEPVISGENGSGTIFFSGCSLKCVFCQNEKISKKNYGKSVSKNDFIEIIKGLEKQGAENINLVNPTHFIDFIYDALSLYKPSIPVIYNTGGYDRVESLKKLEGLVDVYLPDFKYKSSELSKKYSGAENYSSVAERAIAEMKRQQPSDIFEKGLLKKGVIIRHLALPSNSFDTKEVLKTLSNIIPKDSYISLMRQYVPMGSAVKYPEINRKLFSLEYDKAIEAFFEYGFSNGFMQEKTSSKVKFMPVFDLTGIK